MGKNYARTDFAINHLDTDAIVYRSVDGSARRLTEEVFASKAEFLRWKDFSDGNYRETELNERQFLDDLLYLSELSEAAAKTLSAEDAVIKVLAVLEMNASNVRLWGAIEKLKPRQRSCFLLYALSDLSQQNIADRQEISQQMVSKSILSAKNNLKKLLKKRL